MTYPKDNKLNFNNLKMVIGGNKSVAEVKTEFNEQFPFLQIDIYKIKGNGAHVIYEPLKANQKLEGNSNNTWFDIQINNQDTVTILKEHFKQLGFDILIYRKAGKVWVETTLTESWTLERQNLEGEMLSSK